MLLLCWRLAVTKSIVLGSIENKVNKMTKLWSKRWSPARGRYWKLERECKLTDSKEWLAVFRKDEQEVEFRLSKKKPK